MLAIPAVPYFDCHSKHISLEVINLPFLKTLLCFYDAHWASGPDSNHRRTQMHSQKRSTLGLVVVASVVLVSLSVTSTRHQRPHQQCSDASSKTWIADGTAPVPPYPTRPPKSSASSRSTLVADGTAPVPPYPPIPKRNTSATSESTLVADGTAPVPPYPPKPRNSMFRPV